MESIFPALNYGTGSGSRHDWLTNCSAAVWTGAKVYFGETMSRRIHIDIETHRLLVIRRSSPVRACCKECRSEVQLITPDQAAAMMNISSRIVYRWIEEAKLHFIEEPGQSIWICADSITTMKELLVQRRNNE